MNIQHAISGFKPNILKPGEIFFSEGRPAIVATVLGSCVSVTMHHRSSGFGAISHCVLPECQDRLGCMRGNACREWPKYVECSIREMLMRLDELGIARNDVKINLIGGSEMFHVSSRSSGAIKTVGSENMRVAKTTLSREGLRIAASDAGGINGRKIYFITHTGEVYLKRLITKADVKGDSLQ